MTEPARGHASYYPVMLDVSERSCLVVGGGPVAARKARGLLECGASVTVIAPLLSDEMESVTPLLHAVERRRYREGDVSAFRLVVTATGMPEVDGAVFADGEAAGVWVNSADDPAHCSFILPAVHRDRAVTVSVSTGRSEPSPRLMAPGQTGDRVRGRPRHAGAAPRRGPGRLRRAGAPTDSVDWVGLLDGPLPDLVRAGDLDARPCTGGCRDRR